MLVDLAVFRARAAPGCRLVSDTHRRRIAGAAWRVASVGAVVLLTLTGCSATVSMKPAPEATTVACAGVVVRLPAQVAGLMRRETDAQGTGAWGNPVAALLRCGVPVSGPTTQPCFTFGGVDWVARSSSATRVVFDTFGRSPQIETVVDGSRVNAADVVADLSGAVRAAVPSTFMRCLGGSARAPRMPALWRPRSSLPAAAADRRIAGVVRPRAGR